MRNLALVAVALALMGGTIMTASGDVAKDGLILYLDASSQIREGGIGPTNVAWKNLAGQPDTIAGDGALRNFGLDNSSGWVGSGVPRDPYALRFDGQKSYVIGPGNLEIPEITLEAWARVEGYTLRGATLIGNDFGKGGICLLINTATESPILVHQVTFSPVGADTPPGQWQQVVVTLKDGTARAYVNGRFSCSQPAPREIQKDHYPYWQLGAARHPENDFAEADGLIGSLAIVRVYDRALTSDEVLANFNAEKGVFAINEALLNNEPVSSMPVPSAPGLKSPPVRCVKWDYYYNPVRVSAPNNQGWPYAVRQAFDGYPTNLSHPYMRNFWLTDLPTTDKPVSVTIDYRRPVAVTRYIHYFDRSRTPTPWKDVDIQCSDDQETWKTVQSYANLPVDCPQTLAIDRPAAAKHYRIVVKSMAEGAPRIASHEIETYYGATVGSVACAPARAIQSEGCRINVRVVSPDAALSGSTLKLVAPKNSLQGALEVPLPAIVGGGSSTTAFQLVPLRSGRIPVYIELHGGGCLIDRRPYTLEVSPKLAFKDLTPSAATIAAAGSEIALKGILANNGSEPATAVSVTWLGNKAVLADVAPGQSLPFEIKAKVKPGYSEGALTAIALGQTTTTIRRSVIASTASAVSTTDVTWNANKDVLKLSARISGVSKPVTGTLKLLANGQVCSLAPVAKDELAALVPGGVFRARVTNAGDAKFECSVIPNDPNTLTTPWLDLELRLAVDNPKVMFRPHIDWYTVEHGPNISGLFNGHNSATRMLCAQTDRATVAMVPSTDNLVWGFDEKNEMVAQFQMPLAPYDQLNEGIWRPIYVSPTDFSIVLPIRKGDWWEAYRHVVHDIFKFEQPRQWAMPITQMQMLNARYTMRYEVWSEKWQTVRSHPWFDFFYNFYGTTYTLPTLYSWYLVTDNEEARVKAQKVLEWLMSVQIHDGPAAGAWFSQYGVEGNPPELVGRDQAANRWIMPHSTGTSVKTLLWYWEASGKTDARAFAAAKVGCDWLVKIQRPDGGWAYALDLDGKPITDLSDAGQIWCTWSLWKMWEYTGDVTYKDAVLRSRDFFKKTFVDVHRYMGYWEDVSGSLGKVQRSWEGYEPAIAALVFADMGDKDLAIEVAKDAATWSWTRVTSTRDYETSYGETTEQSVCGPSQAQSPMTGIGLHQIFELTGDSLWSDFAGAIKAVNFCADPDQAYGMVATGGWDDPNTGVIGPPYDDTRPFVTPNNGKGDEYGRQVWNEWCTNQFAWLALEWLVREGNIRAPQYVKIDPDTYRGTVLGASGRVKMPEEKCDVNGIDHCDINWVGYSNDDKYVLLVMNHKEKVTVAVRPHEAHLDVYNRPPTVLVSSGKSYEAAKVNKKGVQYMVDIPANGTALLIWDRIK